MDRGRSESQVSSPVLQTLQEQNQKQLAVIRELSAKQENASAEMRAELEAEKQRLKERVDADIADNKRHRLEQQVGLLCHPTYSPMHKF